MKICANRNSKIGIAVNLPTTETILVLDDDPDIREEVRDALTDEGFNVFTAENGAKLWALAKSNHIDLFVLDLMLPGESGLSLVTRIRQESDVGIIIVTGKTGETDRIVGLEIGADDYVSKPFSPRELIARVRTVLRRTRGNAYPGMTRELGDKNIIGFGNYFLDMEMCQLRTTDGEEIHLTTAEYNLLKTFVERPKRVLSREFLMDAIHGREWVGYDRGVDGLVSRLRRKLEPAANKVQLVSTVRGLGYMFVSDVKRN